ncbi:MAG TPA: hypothetical protein VN947_26265 [Polyangia bacterium]|nr:hypothetical protein [Polyangia bacterium]
MRWHVVALVLVAAVVAGSLGFFACSDSPSCQPGELVLHIGLIDNSPQADTITVTGIDPGAAVTESFPHAIDPNAVALNIEHVVEHVTWPQGFPSHAVVHLVVRALLNGTVLGVNTATIQLGTKCGEGSMLVSARYGTDDDAGVTGGF